MKTLRNTARRQRGAVLVVGLIMLVLITLLVTSTVTLSSSNLKAVGNMQFRNEAVAAANSAIETVLSVPFTNAPLTGQQIVVDINNDGQTDYMVQFSIPVCKSASQIASPGIPPSSSSLGSGFSSSTGNYYETVWDLDATVTDVNNSGASVEVHQGVRVLLNQTQFAAVCS
jgi:hypothetical protein